MINLQAYSDRAKCRPLSKRLLLLAAVLAASFAAHAETGPSSQPTTNALRDQNYKAAAGEVMQHIQAAFFIPDDGLYAHSLTERNPEFMWGNGILLSALLGPARHA